MQLVSVPLIRNYNPHYLLLEVRPIYSKKNNSTDRSIYRTLDTDIYWGNGTLHGLMLCTTLQ